MTAQASQVDLFVALELFLNGRNTSGASCEINGAFFQDFFESDLLRSLPQYKPLLWSAHAAIQDSFNFGEAFEVFMEQRPGVEINGPIMKEFLDSMSKFLLQSFVPPPSLQSWAPLAKASSQGVVQMMPAVQYAAVPLCQAWPQAQPLFMTPVAMVTPMTAMPVAMASPDVMGGTCAIGLTPVQPATLAASAAPSTSTDQACPRQRSAIHDCSRERRLSKDSHGSETSSHFGSENSSLASGSSTGSKHSSGWRRRSDDAQAKRRERRQERQKHMKNQGPLDEPQKGNMAGDEHQ